MCFFLLIEFKTISFFLWSNVCRHILYVRSVLHNSLHNLNTLPRVFKCKRNLCNQIERMLQHGVCVIIFSTLRVARATIIKPKGTKGRKTKHKKRRSRGNTLIKQIWGRKRTGKWRGEGGYGIGPTTFGCDCVYAN